MEIFYNLRAHRVHDVAYQRNRGSDGYRLVNEGKVISAGILARCLARLLHPQDVIAALGKTHEEGDKESHQHNPFTQNDLGGYTTSQQTEHETEGYDAYIDDGILFQFGAIAEIQKPIEGNDAHCFP